MVRVTLTSLCPALSPASPAVLQLLHAHGTIGSLCAANVTGACEWVAQLNSDNTFVYFDGTADTTYGQPRVLFLV